VPTGSFSLSRARFLYSFIRLCELSGEVVPVVTLIGDLRALQVLRNSRRIAAGGHDQVGQEEPGMSTGESLRSHIVPMVRRQYVADEGHEELPRDPGSLHASAAQIAAK
jgi:hypothetical protein